MKYKEFDTEYGAVFKYNDLFYCIQTPHGAVNLKTGLFMSIKPDAEVERYLLHSTPVKWEDRAEYQKRIAKA